MDVGVSGSIKIKKREFLHKCFSTIKLLRHLVIRLSELEKHMDKKRLDDRSK